MCGIFSIYLKYNETNLVEICKKTENMLYNRGPNNYKKIKTENFFVGFNRLNIVDLSEKGMQPFVNDNIILLCNGEIYNHTKLKNKYNLECNSKSDCECILHLYKKIGFKKTVKQLEGDFAFILIDGTKIYFARDRIGVRPLFWGITKNGNFALASYARVLTDFCKEVKPVEPGYGIYNSTTNKINFSKYFYRTIDNISKYNIIDLIHNTFIEAIKVRLMGERPIGCLLSGGLDSSLIVSILCKLIGPSNVRTYSIGMEGSQDLKYARIVAQSLGTNHTEVTFTPQEGFDCIPQVIKDLESYDITTIRASVGMWLLSKWISTNTEDIILFSGEGSDELFCGYLYFHYAPNVKELKKESLRLINDLHLYDVLRADRCVSSHGLELRVPFLDYNMLNLCLSIPGELLQPKKGIEKYLLRQSFSNDYLPDEVLWRRKDGMSDGISGNNKKWYEHIQEFVENIISDDKYDDTAYPSKEAQYYRMVYNEIFPTYQPTYDYWLPKWVEHGGDPSGRILEVFSTSK